MRNPGVTLITVTGNRPEAFRLCEYWVSRQTYSGALQWIVVDDGRIPTKVRSGQEYVRRLPTKDDPEHTMCKNLRLAWDLVKFDRVLVIEDDDYYAPCYVETMLGWLEEADLVGEVGARYYFVRSLQYRLFVEHEHASLCRTGFCQSVLPLLKELSSGDDWRLDLKLWSKWRGARKLVKASDKGRSISVSMKGMPGRPGKTHNPSTNWKLQSDLDLTKLREWLGPDYIVYQPFLKQSIRNDDLIVYTCCIGGYDILQRQPEQAGVSYVAVTDGRVKSPWNKIEIETPTGSPRRASRHPKILAHRYFEQATTLYVDANVLLYDPRGLVNHLMGEAPHSQLVLFKHNMRSTVQAEAKAVLQMKLDDSYVVKNYMKRYKGMDCCWLGWGGCILRRFGCERFNEMWWKQYNEGSMRDQLSLPIAACESGVSYHLSDEQYPLYPRQRTRWMTQVRHRKQRMQMEVRV